MFDSRTDSDVVRRAWNCKPDAAVGTALMDREGCKANREMGEGDRIEWSTPKARQLATKRMTRLMVAEGVTEYHDEREAEAFERFVADCEAEYAFHHEH